MTYNIFKLRLGIEPKTIALTDIHCAIVPQRPQIITFHIKYITIHVHTFIGKEKLFTNFACVPLMDFLFYFSFYLLQAHDFSKSF